MPIKAFAPWSKVFHKADRPSPAETETDCALDDKQRSHIAGLMRINHTGEVCAQALYQGQALTAKESTVADAMNQAAKEEVDHLAWCEERIEELESDTSILNPIFYGLSFGIGAVAGMIGDEISLGFVAATENQVCLHLQDHLDQLPEKDQKTRLILEQMLIDEQSHADKAMATGGAEFSPLTRDVMTLMSKVMTKTTYYL